ncbi:hypothetical protein HYW54_05630 [Candidatus Gottesmanbacteria bacterium]|nr:hypothetical protein [Candidatus Gottesmanbacteria bacterium]
MAPFKFLIMGQACLPAGRMRFVILHRPRWPASWRDSSEVSFTILPQQFFSKTDFVKDISTFIGYFPEKQAVQSVFGD